MIGDTYLPNVRCAQCHGRLRVEYQQKLEARRVFMQTRCEVCGAEVRICTVAPVLLGKEVPVPEEAP